MRKSGVEHVLFINRQTGEETLFEFCRMNGIGTLRNVDSDTEFTAEDGVWETILNYLRVGEARSRQSPGRKEFNPDYQWTVEGGDVLIEYIPVPKRQFGVPLEVLRGLHNLFYKKIVA